jgi:hypothetical protein
MLAEATAGWCERYPEVRVDLVPAHSLNPTVALLEASQDAGAYSSSAATAATP